jgi:rhamnosyltransferase
MSEKEKNFCIYAGYNKKSRIRPDVFEQIKSLSSKYSIIYIVSAEDSIKQDPLYFEILKLTSKTIIRNNLGYDFGSWKTGINFLGEKLKNINSLLLMNDSLYGPIFSMDQIIYNTLNSPFDIISMTASEQFGYHAQSYYISYTNKVINNKIFKYFWNNCPIKNIYSDKDKIQMILKYEVQFSRILLKMGFSHKSLFNIQDKLNPTIYSWDKLIDLGMPFIKNALLFDAQDKFTEAAIDFNNIEYYLNKNPLILNKMKQFWIETSEKPINIKY